MPRPGELKSVIIAAETAGGNYGGDCYGLSAVRFVQAAAPPPRPVETPPVNGGFVAKEAAPSDKQAVADVLLGTWTVEKTNGYRGTWTFTSDGKVTNSDRRPLTTRWTIESGAVMIRWNSKLWESLTLPIDPAGSTGPCWQGTAKAVKVR